MTDTIDEFAGITVQTTLNTLGEVIVEANIENGWDVATNADWLLIGENPSVNVDKLMRLLALIHSEVSEAVEEVRVGDRVKFTEELADVIIRTLDLSVGLGLDIGSAVVQKIEKNQKRGQRHGGKLA